MKIQRYGVRAAGADWDIVESGVTGRVVVALPGAMGSGELFVPVFAALGSGVRGIAVTPPALADAAALGAGILAVFDALHLKSAVLLGTSFGGYVAQFAAADAPGRIDMLVLANTFADPTRSANRRDPAAVEAEDATVMHDAALARVRGQAPSAARDALLVELARQPPQLLKARALGLARGGPAPVVALPIERVAVIDTADDPVIAPAMREDLLLRYAGARHTTLPAGGHYPYLADPAGYAAAIHGALAAGAAV